MNVHCCLCGEEITIPIEEFIKALESDEDEFFCDTCTQYLIDNAPEILNMLN